MLVLNLACSHGHRFEGWFGSASDFESQTTSGLLTCPMCSDQRISRMPTAPHLNVSHLRASKAGNQAGPQTTAPAAESTPAVAPSRPVDANSVAPVAAPSQPAESLGHSAEALQGLQAQLLQAVQQVLANTEDVGSQFAEEARRIHYGESQQRGIRGQASADETAALLDEGIDVVTLPLPQGLKGPLQ
ncbi:DUF1178 family protein [Paucibacter sp. KCTC 42545]|uniref:DUF1178 family protein n=1 Tax=Paucibacter sp. KCTC 42545 TaxID=1768242 RepID=UPI000733A2DF|nr:DUF1178 family protein [Paucibacter sp. KCTC 42545]ALT77099.1 hypothetical protein AT984_07740 [Paucibacter sp. KCTC 42545]